MEVVAVASLVVGRRVLGDEREPRPPTDALEHELDLGGAHRLFDRFDRGAQRGDLVGLGEAAFVGAERSLQARVGGGVRRDDRLVEQHTRRRPSTRELLAVVVDGHQATAT